MKDFATEAIAVVTLLSGALSVLSGLGWTLGAPDGKFLFLIGFPIFLVFAVILSFIKDGWLRLLGQIYSVWPF